MRRINGFVVIVLLLSLLGVAQQAKPLLKIDNKTPSAISISQEDWAKLPRATVMATRGHSKDKVQYEGVPLKALLERAGVLNAEKPLHGKQLLQYVVVSAADGYRVLFSLAELEEATGATSNVLLADKVAGKPLDRERSASATRRSIRQTSGALCPHGNGYNGWNNDEIERVSKGAG